MIATPPTDSPDPTTADAAETAAAVDTAQQVKWIHAHSGLSWKELARMFGTSKNQVHMWTNGTRVHASQAARLMQLEDIIRGLELDVLGAGMIDVDLPDRLYGIEMRALVRQRLTTQRPDAINGTSIVDQWRRDRCASPTWGAPFPPEHLVGAIR